jgi:membrane protein DedA with SNARE-associated domain
VVFFGETIWTGILVLVGYYAAQAIKQKEQGIEALMLGSTFLFLVLLVWLIPRILPKDHELGNEN